MNEELERWESRFADDEYAFGEAPNAFLARQKPLLPTHGKALAISDGEGRNGVWMAEQGLDVTSFDFSPRGVQKAKALAARRGVKIDARVADIYSYPWPHEAYDVIAVIFIQYMDPTKRRSVFAGIRHALKTGGLLLMEGYTPKQIEHGSGGPKQPENMYTRELLEREFGGFADLTIEDYESVLQEGSSHGGRSALIDLIAHK